MVQQSMLPASTFVYTRLHWKRKIHQQYLNSQFSSSLDNSPSGTVARINLALTLYCSWLHACPMYCSGNRVLNPNARRTTETIATSPFELLIEPEVSKWIVLCRLSWSYVNFCAVVYSRSTWRAHWPQAWCSGSKRKLASSCLEFGWEWRLCSGHTHWWRGNFQTSCEP